MTNMLLNNDAKIAIVGAGISGLTLASLLEKYSEVSVFEKSRGVGGRMATRYTDDYEFDHGAQYFVAKTTKFKNFLVPFLETGVVNVWRAKFAEIENDKVLNYRQWNNEPTHFIPTPKMNGLCKTLAKSINVFLNHQVINIEKKDSKWHLDFANQKSHGPFDWIILSAPAEQTAGLAPSYTSFKSELANIKMLPCFSLMLGYSNQLMLPWDVAVIKDNLLSWIANNSSKPLRTKKNSLLVLSSNLWAQENFNEADDIIKGKMLDKVVQIIGNNVFPPKHIQLHRWRYANCTRREGQKYFIDPNNQLAACGDWCIKGRIEAAFSSANGLFEALRSC